MIKSIVYQLKSVDPILYLLLFFILVFLIFYPKIWLIADENSYFNRGLSLSRFEKEWFLTDPTNSFQIKYTGTNYPLGTPMVIAGFILLFGKKSVFMIGLLCFSTSVLLTRNVLKQLAFSTLGNILFFIYPSVLMLSRTMMSGMPSLLLSSLFFYVFFCKQRWRFYYFLLAFIAGLSVFFRETNIVVFVFFLLFLFLKEKESFWQLFLGLFFGGGIRFYFSYLIYGSGFYTSNPESFGLIYIFRNFPLYFILTMLLIPLGLWNTYRYNGNNKWEIKLTIIAFLMIYLTYSFNPMPYSGIAKGLLFGGRFLIPLLPLFTIVTAYAIKENPLLKIKPFLLIGGVGSIFFSQYIGNQFNKAHYNISQKIYHDYSDKPIILDLQNYTSINRYINPFHGLINQQVNIIHLEDSVYAQKLLDHVGFAYIALSMRFENNLKKKRNDRIISILNQLEKSYQLRKAMEMSTFDGTTVQIWKIQKGDNQENN